LIEQLKQILIKHEGVVLTPYHCPAGKLTIGVGRNLEANGISRDEAMFMLDNDIKKIEHEAKMAFDWYKDLNDARKIVVLSMIFNLGFAGFQRFRQVNNFLSRKLYESAAEAMLDSHWAKQVGPRARELAQIMKTGQI
jgi:lysozyme